MSRYALKHIEKVAAPEGGSFNNWYKFIIANNYNTITNIRCGSEKEIRQYAKQTIKRLNEKYLTHYEAKTFNRTVNETAISYSF